MTPNESARDRTGPRGTVAPRGEREIVAERLFDAPRARVWAAYNDPDLVPRWWGPARLTTLVERMEVRAGGRWRIVQVDPDGTEYAFHGEYREVVPPERLVQTFVYEGAPTETLLQTATFVEEGTRTRLKLRVEFSSAAARQGMVDADMESGLREGWARLDALLAEG